MFEKGGRAPCEILSSTFVGRTEENNSKTNTTCFCLYLIALPFRYLFVAVFWGPIINYEEVGGATKCEGDTSYLSLVKERGRGVEKGLGWNTRL